MKKVRDKDKREIIERQTYREVIADRHSERKYEKE